MKRRRWQEFGRHFLDHFLAGRSIAFLAATPATRFRFRFRTPLSIMSAASTGLPHALSTGGFLSPRNGFLSADSTAVSGTSQVKD
ncbi:hypothetical protein ABZ490_08420 [Streptomyces sp. NPDC005811]|uniref:hypothetical protein n=1 Tax=Streptomyces sp. NPDC005811 TaxID=3154565 RepID=UPI0033CA9FA2